MAAKPLVYNATLRERIDVTSALTVFRIQPDEPPPTRPWFVPGRVEQHFAPDRLATLEQRLDLPAGGFTPARAVIFICGLQGTIGTTITNLIDRGFVPDQKRMREALGVPSDVPASLFFEQYDTEPVIDIKTPAVIEPLRARMRSALGLA